MFKYSKDPIIYPRESAWFGEEIDADVIIPMEQTQIYKDNTFGLKTL